MQGEGSLSTGLALKSSNARRFALVALAAVAINILLLFSAQGVSSARQTAASLLLWLCVVPVCLWIRKPEGTPFLAAYLCLNFMYYGLPAFSESVVVRGYSLSEASLVQAGWIVLVGVFCFMGTYLVGSLFAGASRSRTAGAHIRAESFQLPLCAVAIVGVVMRWLAFSGTVHQEAQLLPKSVEQIGNLISDLGLVAVAGLSLAFMRRQATLVSKLALASVVIGYTLIGFSTGAIGQPLRVGAVLFFVYAAERRKFPVVQFVLIAVLLLPFWKTKRQFRNELASSPDQGVFERSSRFFSLTVDSVNQGETTLGDGSDTAQERLNSLGSMAYVVQLTPSRIPYWNGDTYKSLLWAPVPRFLYPDKPMKSLGQEYGHRYGFLDDTDRLTSVNMQQLAEFYANFGTAGVFCGMALLGLLYSGLAALLDPRRAGDPGVTTGALIYTGLLSIESDFSLVHGSLPFWLFGCWLLWRLVGALPMHAAAQPTHVPLR